MRLSELDKLQRQNAPEPATLADLDALLAHLLPENPKTGKREPTPTMKAFIYDDSFLKAYMGPAGCAKSTTGCLAIILRCLVQPGCKALITRNDYNKLIATTMVTAKAILSRLPPDVLVGRDKSPPEKWYLKPIYADPKDQGKVSEILFMNAKDDFGSFEFNCAFIDEADDIERTQFNPLLGRFRAPGGNYCLMLCFNPPPKAHWLYTACTGKNEREQTVEKPMFKLFRPQPDENATNLPDGYYQKLRANLPKEDIDRLVDGLWGTTFPGSPVYKQFRREMHVKHNLKYIPGSPLYRWWDFGYRFPVCIWVQCDAEGRMYVLRCEMGENIEARPWARKCNQITAVDFHGCEEVYDFGDPAVRQHKDTGTTLAHLAQEGIHMRWRISKILDGVRLVRQKLDTLVSGLPALMVDSTCGVLIDAFKGGYYLDKDGVTPVKDGFYDHSMDALRYGILNMYGPLGTTNVIHTASTTANSVAYDASQDTYGQSTVDSLLALAKHNEGY